MPFLLSQKFRKRFIPNSTPLHPTPRKKKKCRVTEIVKQKKNDFKVPNLAACSSYHMNQWNWLEWLWKIQWAVRLEFLSIDLRLYVLLYVTQHELTLIQRHDVESTLVQLWFNNVCLVQKQYITFVLHVDETYRKCGTTGLITLVNMQYLESGENLSSITCKLLSPLALFATVQASYGNINPFSELCRTLHPCKTFNICGVIFFQVNKMIYSPRLILTFDSI